MRQKTSVSLGEIRSFGYIELLGIILLYSVFMSLFVPGFFTLGNLINIAINASILGIMASGVTFVMITGNIDLTCGAVMTLSACVSCSIIDFSPFLALIVPLLIGIFLGQVNGLLIGGLRFNSFITTLGLLYIYQALAFLFTSSHYFSSTYTGWYSALGQGSLFGVPIPLLLFLGIVIVSFFVQEYSAFGAKLFAVGCNPINAGFSGAQPMKVTILVYIISSLCSSFAGVLLCARTMAAQPKTGMGFEFDVFIAVMIGGIISSKFNGNAIGTLLGVLFLTILKNSFSLMRLWSGVEYIVEGAVLFLIILIQLKRSSGDPK